MNRGQRRNAPIIEWDNIKEVNPNLVEDMKIVEKLSSIGCIQAYSSEDIAKGLNKIKERIEMSEMVNHPSHYGGEDNPYEAIKVIEAWEADFNIGTTLRYLCRAGKKTIGGNSEEMRLEDLKKARWYLTREIENIERSN